MQELTFISNERDIELKEELCQLPLTLFCIHGNHEERPDLVGTYEEKEWQECLWHNKNTQRSRLKVQS